MQHILRDIAQDILGNLEIGSLIPPHVGTSMNSFDDWHGVADQYDQFIKKLKKKDRHKEFLTRDSYATEKMEKNSGQRCLSTTIVKLFNIIS